MIGFKQKRKFWGIRALGRERLCWSSPSSLQNYSLTLADRIAVQTKDGLGHVVKGAVEAVGNPGAQLPK